MRAFAPVLCLFLFASFSLAEKGLDISNYNGVVNQNTYQNFVNQGYDFSVIQAYQENHPNTNFQENYNNAIGAGMNHVDAYAFVCNTCHGGTTPSQVVSSLQSTLPSNYQGTVWLDVESCSGCWTANGQENHQFVQTIASQLQSNGYNVGIYSNKNEWNEVMGSASSNTNLDNLPLWYAHYDQTATFNDPNAYQFGGWTDPEFKQYAGDAKVDGQDVDLDYGSNVDNDVDGKSKSDAEPSKQDSDKSKADSSKADSKADSSKAASSKADSSKDSSDKSKSKSSDASSKDSSKDSSKSVSDSSKSKSADSSKSSDVSSKSSADSSKTDSESDDSSKTESTEDSSEDNSSDDSSEENNSSDESESNDSSADDSDDSSDESDDSQSDYSGEGDAFWYAY